MGLILLCVNYFANSGIHGSTDLMWASYLLLLFAISPYRQHLTWLIACLVTFVTLHLIEYHYPQLVKHPFNIGLGQLIDRTTAFPLPIITIYIIIKYIKRSYDKEKRLVESRNQEILHQKELLEQSNAEKNKLMSIISHDMRAPLINIQGYLELLNADVIRPEERPALEKELLLANNNTMQMLSNMLYWTKTQMEQPTIHLTDIGLLKIMQTTLGMQQTLAQKKGITLTYNISPDINVHADIDMLQLVVRNLVSNAIKFTPKDGSITVSAEQVGDECKIIVADNGMGIQPGQQEKLFRITTEPTYGTNHEKGVGLGLTLCKEYIERQGGRIGYESVFGHGASFFVFIPMPAAARPRTEFVRDRENLEVGTGIEPV
ncbi:hypothetical protein GCM10028827_27090 [Mucilaginibacter myungsuensis]